MKKKISIGLLVIITLVTLFTMTGCVKKESNNSNTDTNNLKEYSIDGVSFKLDKKDTRDGIKYSYSSSFDRNYGASTSSYNLYYDKNKSTYDVSNLAFNLYVTVNIMQTEPNIEKYINQLKGNSSYQNLTQEQKTINGVTWEYITLDNYYETGSNDHYKNHTYLYEKYDGQYYVTYIISFNKADNIEEFENDLMNGIVFDK